MLLKLNTDNFYVKIVNNCKPVADLIKKGMDGNLAYKIFAINFLSMLDKLVYISYDSIIQNNLIDLFDMNMNNNAVSAIKDYSYNNESQNKYFSKNLLVIDTEKIKKFNLEEVYFGSKPNMSEKDFLNAILKCSVNIINDKWCLQWARAYDEIDDDVKNNYAIINFNSADKPWTAPQHQFADVFWKYARITDFYEEIIFMNISKNKTIPNNNTPKSPQKRTLWERYKTSCKDIGFFKTWKKAIKKGFIKIFKRSSSK